MDAETFAAVLSDAAHWGPVGLIAGLLILAVIKGWLVPGKAHDREIAQGDAWKALYESERDAHARTREAYIVQGERLQVAVESGRVTEQMLREARRHAISPD